MALGPGLDPSRFSSWSRLAARLALATLLAGIVACMVVSWTRPTRPAEPRAGDTDADLFRKVVGRVHTGESPHDAFEHVFHEYNYPVRSVLNYRTPLHAWFLGQLPGPRWGRAILALLMLTTALMAYSVLRDEGACRAAAGVLLMLGAFAFGLVEDLYLYTEVWAGTLIALSVCAYALGGRTLGWAAGVLALFCRELALPYALVCLALALRGKSRREAAAWCIGLAVYGLHFAAHVVAVAPRIPPAAGLLNGSGWVHYGGLAFVLATCRMNLLLLAAPSWVAAVVLPLCLLGFWGGRDDASERAGLVVALYLAVFSVVGGIFNAYWGLMDAALLPFGLVRSPSVLRDLIAAAVQGRTQVDRRTPDLQECVSARVQSPPIANFGTERAPR